MKRLLSVVLTPFRPIQFWFRRKKIAISKIWKKNKKKFIRWSRQDKVKRTAKYFKQLISIYIVYGTLLSIPAWAFFNIRPNITWVFGLGVAAYLIKVELPSIIRESRR